MMTRLQQVVAKSLAYGWSDRLLLMEALLWLGLSRLVLSMIPFRWIASSLAAQCDPEWETKRSPAAGQRIGWAVRAVAGHTPWQSTCLVQSIAAKRMLQRRGIPSTLCLGVAKSSEGPMQAHAWLRCNVRFITGEAGHQQYTVVASFADL